MKYFSIVLFAALFVTIATVSAQAMLISNLSGTPQQVVVINGQQKRTVSLQPNGVYRAYGRWIILQKEGQPDIRVRGSLEEYVIWPGGKLLIQRYNHSRGIGGSF